MIVNDWTDCCSQPNFVQPPLIFRTVLALANQIVQHSLWTKKESGVAEQHKPGGF